MPLKQLYGQETRPRKRKHVTSSVFLSPLSSPLLQRLNEPQPHQTAAGRAPRLTSRALHSSACPSSTLGLGHGVQRVTVHQVRHGGGRRRREDLHAHLLHKQQVPHCNANRHLFSSLCSMPTRCSNDSGFSWIPMEIWYFPFLLARVISWVSLSPSWFLGLYILLVQKQEHVLRILAMWNSL